MSFTGLRQQLDTSLAEVKSTQDYVKVYLTTSVQDELKKLEDKYIEHLFSDLIQDEPENNIQTFLSGSYKNANEYAKTCVLTAFRSRDLYGLKIAGWTDSALKCFDNFLLILIQDRLNETIKKRTEVGIERQKYWHLIDKGDDFYHIGMGFDVVYQKRNEFSHVEVIEDSTGKRRQRPLSRKDINKKKEIIFENLKKALISLDRCMN